MKGEEDKQISIRMNNRYAPNTMEQQVSMDGHNDPNQVIFITLCPSVLWGNLLLARNQPIPDKRGCLNSVSIYSVSVVTS